MAHTLRHAGMATSRRGLRSLSFKPATSSKPEASKSPYPDLSPKSDPNTNKSHSSSHEDFVGGLLNSLKKIGKDAETSDSRPPAPRVFSGSNKANSANNASFNMLLNSIKERPIKKRTPAIDKHDPTATTPQQSTKDNLMKFKTTSPGQRSAANKTQKVATDFDFGFDFEASPKENTSKKPEEPISRMAMKVLFESAASIEKKATIEKKAAALKAQTPAWTKPTRTPNEPTEEEEFTAEEMELIEREMNNRMIDEGPSRRSLKKERREGRGEVLRDRKAEVQLTRRITLQTFAKRTKQPVSRLIMLMLKNGRREASGKRKFSGQSVVNTETQEMLCIEMDLTPIVGNVLAEQVKDLKAAAAQEGVPRAPVVCVMGHVDHGKTTLMDQLRKSNVVAQEAGGITQSIGAFSVPNGSVFLDTPGHAAFRGMRARGANKHLTDLVVLIVAANSGVQPQTIEAIKMAESENVPVVVAINKCDIDGADPDKIRTDLMKYNLVDEGLGGDTIMVNISAKSGMGLEELSDAISLTADMLELKAPVDGPAEAAVVESRVQRGLGIVVNAVTRSGTLKPGMWAVCGTQHVKIRGLVAEGGKRIKTAGPITPVGILGFQSLEGLGNTLMCVGKETQAKALAQEYARGGEDQAEDEERSKADFTEAFLAKTKIDLPARFWRKRKADERAGVTFTHKAEEDNVEGLTFRAVVKADVSGALEAVLEYVATLPRNEINIQVIRSGVGGVNVTDIETAKLLGAHVYGFNVEAASQAQDAARLAGVQLITDKVIYKIMDGIRDHLAALLPKTIKMEVVGAVEVSQIFSRSKGKGRTFNTAGCKVTKGSFHDGPPANVGTVQYVVKRDTDVIHEGAISSMFHFKDEVHLMEKGKECAITLRDFGDFESGDIIECHHFIPVAAKFDDSIARGTLPDPALAQSWKA